MRRGWIGALAIVLTAGWPLQAFAASGQEPGLGMLAVKSVAALAAVLGLFSLIVWVMRRIQGGRMMTGKMPLRLEQRMSLDNRNTLAVVRYEGQRWLVGISPSGLTLIDRLPLSQGEQQPPVQASSGEA